LGEPTYRIEDCLQGVIHGDEQAFARLFAQEYPAVYAAAHLVTNNEALAEEVVQDVFLTIWLRRQKLADIKDFKAYLFIIARNRAYKALKKQLAWETLPEGNVLPDENIHLADLESKLRKEQLFNAIEEALQQLSPQQLEVFTLTRQQHKKREEVARLMGLSPETVKKYLAAVSLKIRAYCQAHYPDLLVDMIGLLVLLSF